MPLLETAITFVLSMLAASLFIAVIVEAVVRVGNYRALGLTVMLKGLIHGFRTYHNDPNADADPYGFIAEDQAFVADVLGDPVFFARAEAIDSTTDLTKQSRLMDYVSADDLAGIIYNYCSYYADPEAHAHPEAKAEAEVAKKHEPEPPKASAINDPTTTAEMVSSTVPPPAPDLPANTPPVLRLPKAWMGKSYDRDYAKTDVFAAYLARWFDRLERTASENYRAKVLRLTTVISLTVVVLFNFDGLQVLGNLYSHADSRAALMSQTSGLEATAQQVGALGPVAPLSGSASLDALWKTSSILDQADIGLGWQRAPIVYRWCAYRSLCSDPAPPSGWRIFFETMKWLLGIGFSFAMLSLGAPFWYKMLVAALNFSAQKAAKAAPPKTTTS